LPVPLNRAGKSIAGHRIQTEKQKVLPPANGSIQGQSSLARLSFAALVRPMRQANGSHVAATHIPHAQNQVLGLECVAGKGPRRESNPLDRIK
jgi:hypothetical protein